MPCESNHGFGRAKEKTPRMGLTAVAQSATQRAPIGLKLCVVFGESGDESSEEVDLGVFIGHTDSSGMERSRLVTNQSVEV